MKRGLCVFLVVWMWIGALPAASVSKGPPKSRVDGASVPSAADSPSKSLPLPWDTMDDPYIITELPFSHYYSNVGYSRNYSMCCPYCYGPTPDVVYRYDPPVPMSVEINLCSEGTDYDTVFYIFRNGPADPYTCNDDACTSPDFPYPYVSRLESVPMDPGNAYYIVVGGYCSQTGNYHLTITERDTHHLVRPDGSGEFATIQDAVDASYYGDVVELTDGTFTGPGNRALVLGGTSITLRSLSGDPSLCILDCQEAARGFFLNQWQPSSTLIEGITIRNGAAPGNSGGGVFLGEDASPVFRNCVIENCRARYGAGVAVLDGARFEQCRFRQNWASESGGAIYAISSLGVNVIDCTLDGNKAALRGGGICLTNAHQTSISGCTLTDNRITDAEGIGGAIFSDYLYSGTSLSNTIVAYNQAPNTGGLYAAQVNSWCSDFFGNSNEDWGGSDSQIGWYGNISLDPLFCDFAGEDYHLQAESPCAPNTPPNPECALIGAWPAPCPTTAVAEVEPGVFLRLWPNPARDGCSLMLPARAPGRVTVEVFDPAGRLVRALPEPAADGRTTVLTWDQRDDAGRPVPSGVYLVRARWGAGEEALRVAVLR